MHKPRDRQAFRPSLTQLSNRAQVYLLSLWLLVSKLPVSLKGTLHPFALSFVLLGTK